MMGSEENIEGEGEEDEIPVHRVVFTSDFYISPTEVTFSQYDAFAKATARPLPDDSGFGRGDRPVINVDWSEARAYTLWLSAMTGASCRLPSEAEWEYACRAGTTTQYALPAPHGSNYIEGMGRANCDGCGSIFDDDRTAPVRTFTANAWGLYDMHGNVEEWVEDCGYMYQAATDDGRAWLEEDGASCNVRGARGGSWTLGTGTVRCAFRDRLAPVERTDYLGFRVVCSSQVNDR